jgi:tetratricopeptide (TPR) repeat protein
MKIFGMRIAGGLTACLLGLVWLAQPGRMMAQVAAPAEPTASMHGHVQDPLGAALAGGVVKLSTDRGKNTVNRNFQYQFPIDNNGDYKGEGIKPGTYLMIAFNNKGVDVDYQTAALAAGDDKAVDFDMTRKAYIDAMSPAERDQMEQTKKANADIMAKNAKIENLNAALKQAQADTAAGNYAAAIKAMTDATAAVAQANIAKSDEALLWDKLGDAQLGDAVAADNAAKAAKTVDPTVKDKLAAAVTSYQKTISLNAAAEKPNPVTTAVANNQLGQALGRLGKTQEAAAAYDAAAAADPKGAGKYYFNEAVTLYNVSVSTGKVDGLVDAADKAIAADPTKSEAYYLKTQGLAPLITMGPDGKTFVAPPGLVDACNMYLKLAPAGVHAADIKGLLAGLNETVQTNYKAPPTTTTKKK